MQPRVLKPHVKDDERQQKKREGRDGKPGAGRIAGKGGAGTSNKATGGKGAK